MTTLLFTLSAITLGEILLAAVVGRFLRSDGGAFERSRRLAAVTRPAVSQQSPWR